MRCVMLKHFILKIWTSRWYSTRWAIQNLICHLRYSYEGKRKYTWLRKECDNWYTSVPLVDELLKKLTLFGTIIKNKKQLPKEFIQQKTPSKLVFGFHNKVFMTLYSYCKKKNKNVILLSTMHTMMIQYSKQNPD